MFGLRYALGGCEMTFDDMRSASEFEMDEWPAEEEPSLTYREILSLGFRFDPLWGRD
jgi:hypothetical protein